MGDRNEDIFSGIPLGKWNLLSLSIVCLQQASSPLQYYSTVFVNMPIGFRCSNNITIQNNITYNDSCFIATDSNKNAEYDEILLKCSSYEFDTSQFSSTFTSEFHLVCDKAWISSMFYMILPLGSVIGTFFVGTSDKWGRVTVIQISSTIHVGGALIVGLAPYAYLVILGRFIVGLSYPIFFGSAMTLCLETISPKHRTTVGFMVYIPFYIFVILLGILAYFIRDWRMLYLITSIPVFPIPILSLFLDKSPRWLIQQGQVDQAYTVINKASKINKGMLIDLDLNSIEKETGSDPNEHHYIYDTIESVRLLITQLYGTAFMLKLSIVIPFIWLLTAMVYICVLLNAVSFTNNPYYYIIMLGAAEFPAAFLGPLIIKCFGNIKTGMFLFLLTFLCMLGTILAKPGNIRWMKWTFAMLSMTCSGAVITISSLFVAELFPTVTRSTGYGMSNTAYYIGFFLGCFINSNSLVKESWWASNGICGACCISAAILISILPETHGQKLCETTHEVNRNDKVSKIRQMRLRVIPC